MKKILFLAQIFLSSLALYAQVPHSVTVADIPVIGISGSVSLHFISPEKISYVDLSSSSLIGDLPEKNILRIKAIPDSVAALSSSGDAGLVTIVGETFIAQYRLSFLSPASPELISTQIDIVPTYMRSLDISGIGLSQNEMKSNALSLLKRRGDSRIKKESAFGISLVVNRVYTLSDCILLDLSFQNSTNLIFDVDELRFKIADRKINKSTNVQSIELKPVFQLYPFERFSKSYRNIYILKKTTFPGDKELSIELSEKQISGRNLRASLRYSDILNADTF
ncbi:conjugative transposon protein TraN [Pedobacter jeongneungensis]|uniref:Conjugative transposon protein TraN n=1 Tax=Pedobacter jeongneungensis TaxID=947309 RepID=A0ABP8B2C2_9SPHI